MALKDKHDKLQAQIKANLARIEKLTKEKDPSD